MVDILTTADAFRAEIDPAIPPITVTTMATTPTVVTNAGWSIPVDTSLDRVAEADTVIIPALGALSASDVLEALADPQVKAVIEAVSTVEPQMVAAACSGTFPLAEAGLLDGRTATTSWWLGAAFRSRYRKVRLDMDRMVVADDSILTAGAAFAHVDLGLSLVASVSPALSELVANVLVVDERSAQGSYVALEMLARSDDLVRKFERHVRANLDRQLTVESVAAAIGASPRTIQRRVADTVGMTPIALIQRIRAERARHLMRTTDLSIDRIAIEVGYRNASTLRALLRRHSGAPKGRG